MAKIEYTTLEGIRKISVDGEPYTVLKYLGKIKTYHKFLIFFEVGKKERIVNYSDINKNTIRFNKSKTKVQLKKISTHFEQLNYSISEKCCIISLDQATYTTGYAVWKHNTLHDYGTFVSASDNVHRRVYEIASKFEEYLVYHKPDYVLLEGIYLGGNVVTYRALAALQSVIINLCIHHKTEFVIIPAAQWKNGEYGKGRASQKRNSVLDFEKHNGALVNDDIADAYGLLKYFIGQCSNTYNW